MSGRRGALPASSVAV
ncbi:hypothetical protein E2C01_085007 [Portunus trituberculatus]|uniref:Uncharacterized protein n=1 Tax=Portunus trituberculatus TaxID=210409 RepID=A0A5B7IZT9_PORTR|nr:hypothetical protein [Portunus trituberculatus]